MLRFSCIMICLINPYFGRGFLFFETFFKIFRFNPLLYEFLILI